MYLFLMGEWNHPEYVIHIRGRFFNLSKGKHVLKRAESHRCEVNTLGILDFSMFYQRGSFKIYQRDSFKKIGYRI